MAVTEIVICTSSIFSTTGLLQIQVYLNQEKYKLYYYLGASIIIIALFLIFSLKDVKNQNEK